MLNNAMPDGVGIGLRQPLIEPLQTDVGLDFLEFAPENWIGAGGLRAEQLRWFAEHYPLVCHGLSLSLGGLAPLDLHFIAQLKDFLDTHKVGFFSEHLSYCSDEQGHLHSLLPIPFTDDAVKHVVERIRQVQDVLGRQIAVENGSYYCAPGQAMAEIDFTCQVLEQADCLLLFDVNNLYVNSRNHQFDPLPWLRTLPSERIVYLHVAGHDDSDKACIVDTHGEGVCASVWDLLADTYRTHGLKPTLLERDANIPPLAELMDEVAQIRRIRAAIVEEEALCV